MDRRSTIVHVPERRDAPNVGHTDETKDGRKDGTLTETDKTMEYRLLPDGEWKAITGSTVRNLAPGTYEVRYAATAFDMASKVQTVVIGKGSSDNNDGSGNQGGSNSGPKLYLLNRSDHMAYIAGRTTTQAAPNADITRAEVATILYRLLTVEAKATYTISPDNILYIDQAEASAESAGTVEFTSFLSGVQDCVILFTGAVVDGESGPIPAAVMKAEDEAERSKPGTLVFSDVSAAHWFYDDVAYVVRNGLMSGVGSQRFAPDGTTTRGMIMTILARMDGVDTIGGTNIPWYQAGMEWSVRAGVSDGTNPEAAITREQFAAMLWRYAGEPVVTGDLSAWPDAGDVHYNWAGSAMTWAVQNGIINGSNGKLDPQGNALRSQAAAMLTRFCKYIRK